MPDKELLVFDVTEGVRIKYRDNGVDIRVIKSSVIHDELKPIFGSYVGRDDPFIVDAGAFIGTTAIIFSLKFPDALVIALEPVFENFEILVENVKRFPNIVPIQAALVPKSGFVPMYDRGTGPWGFTAVGESIKPEKRSRLGLKGVWGISLAEILAGFGKDFIDILKIDIEGGEKSVFENAGDWIGRTNYIAAELHDRITPGCTDAFLSAIRGFETISKSKEKVVCRRQLT